jgi:eukaryotic-like serine/threonine-protein kinase
VSQAVGTRFGAYQITARIGVGGMGEVYRARDTRLKRDVALKILPETFAADPERLARFQREAEVLAALNHPNIATIYGIEESNGTRALVMELVEGETLADRIARGPIPVDEALPIAKQIAEALEAAHEQGIIHRDLKPANIKVRPDGTVKVLDFGLAKLAESTTGSVTNPTAMSMSPTITSPAPVSGVGVLLGTAAYMSPEQARGLPADHRADVFAFGCVLYEMLTGRQPFHGETAPDILAAVLARDPDFSTLPANLNPRLADLLKRCLAKQPKRRWQAVGDLRVELENIAAAPTVQPAANIVPPRLGWRLIAAMVAIVLAAGLLGFVAATRFRPVAVPEVTRVSMTLPEGQRFDVGGRRRLAISRDGKQMAYIAGDHLYVRALSQLEPKLLVSEGKLQGIQEVVFSPDGQWIAYYSADERTFKRIATAGGTAIPLAQVANPAGATWGSDGILFGGSRAIMRVNADGGSPEPIIQLEANEIAFRPEMLPGGHSVMFTVFTPNDLNSSRLVVQSIGLHDRKIVAEGGSDAHYLPTGHIVYKSGGVLFAKRFDVRRVESSGSPIPIVEGIETGVGVTGSRVGQYSVSDTGTLIYLPGPASLSSGLRQVVMIDRVGETTALDLPPGLYDSPRFSPDNTRLALVIDDGKQAQVYVYQLSGAALLRQLTFEGRNRFPLWSPDGRRIVFQSTGEGDTGIWWQQADGVGVAERLTRAEKDATHIPESFLGKTDTFSFSDVESADNVLLRTFSIAERKAAQFGDVRSTAPLNSEFSPDGRWVAYTVRGSGGINIYVQPVPPTGVKYLGSTPGGHHSEWSHDGNRLLYFPLADPLASVPVMTRNGFDIGNSSPIPGGFVSSFTSPQNARPYDISPDGLRMVAVVPQTSNTGSAPRIEVVLNWFTELKQRVPTR